MALSLAACGGRSASDSDGGAAAGANGGTSANGGASASGGSAAVGAGGAAGSAGTGPAYPILYACPTQAPTAGTPCEPHDGICSYQLSHCNSINLECLEGQWIEAPQTDGASYQCISFAGAPPEDGAACECQGLLNCTFDDCGAAGTGRIHAVCDNTSWHVARFPCEQQRMCGMSGMQCKVNEACVHTVPDDHYACAIDPCSAQDESTSCDCGAALCPNAYACVSATSDGQVVCAQSL